MTSNGTTYFLTSATSAQQNSYMEDFNDAEQDWFLDEDQQVQPAGSPTGDDFSALFNVPIDDNFFGGEPGSSHALLSEGPTTSNLQAEQFSQGPSSQLQGPPQVVQPPYQPYGSEAGPSGYSQPPPQQMQNQQFETLQPYDPCQSAPAQTQYNPSGQQQQPYPSTSNHNLNHTSGTEFDLSAAAELAAAFETQQPDGAHLPPFERPMQSGTYVPECQPSTSSASQFHGGADQQAWMGGLEMGGGMPLNQQQQQQYGCQMEGSLVDSIQQHSSGYRIVQREDGQQIAYVEQQQEMLSEMSGQYLAAAPPPPQSDGSYHAVQVLPSHSNPAPHILQNQPPSFHSMQAQPLISSSQPPPQLLNAVPDQLVNNSNCRRVPPPKSNAKKAPQVRPPTTSSFASDTLGSVMEKIFANTGDMNAAVRFTPEKSAEFGQILCQYNSLMAEQEASGMDLSMQIKAVEERIVALLSVAEPTSQTSMSQHFPQSTPQPPAQTQTTAKPPAKSRWRKKPTPAKPDANPQNSIKTPVPQPNLPAQLAAVIQMDPSMAGLTPQQLAQFLPSHLTSGANGQPVSLLLDFGPAGQQQIQLQTLSVAPVLEPPRRVPPKKTGKNGVDGALEDTIDQVVGHQQPLYVFNSPNGTAASTGESIAASTTKVAPKRKSRAKSAVAQQKSSGQAVCNARPATPPPPPPPIILPSPAELGKKIEERRNRRKENVSKEFDILLDSLAEEDCEKPFASKSDCIQRVLPFAFTYEPDMSQNLLDQFDHELLRHSVSIMERRKGLESRMRSILFKEALGEDAYNHELSMLLHLDSEYEKRALAEEREMVSTQPSKFVPDPYVLKSISNSDGQPALQKPSTSSVQPADTNKDPSTMDFDYHEFDPQDYLNRVSNMTATPSPPTPQYQYSEHEEEEESEPLEATESKSSQIISEENCARIEQKPEELPSKVPSPLPVNGQPKLPTSPCMKSPGPPSFLHTKSPEKTLEEVTNRQESPIQKANVHFSEDQTPEPVSQNKSFGVVKPNNENLSQASTSQTWPRFCAGRDGEPQSLSHLPPKLRLTRARLQLPLMPTLHTDARPLDEGERLLEQNVEDCQMQTGLMSQKVEVKKEKKFGMETSDGDDADEDLKELDNKIYEQVAERRVEEAQEEKSQDQQECKRLPLKIKLNRNPLKSPLRLTLSNHDSNEKHSTRQKESKEDRKRRKKEEKREKKRLKHLYQSSSHNLQENCRTPEKLLEKATTSHSSPLAPVVSLIPGSPPLSSPIPSPNKRRKPCWETCSNPNNESSPPKLASPQPPKKPSVSPTKIPVNGLKLRISKVLLSNKNAENRQEEAALQEETVTAESVVEVEENGKHHHSHKSNGSKRKKKREHRTVDKIEASEKITLAKEKRDEKPELRMKIPRLKIKMIPEQGGSLTSSEVVSNHQLRNHHHHQISSFSENFQPSSSGHDSPLTLKIRPIKPPLSQAPQKAASKKTSPKESRPLASPYTNSITSAFKVEVNQLCSPLLNGNHALFGLPAAQMRQDCGSNRQAPPSPAFGGLSSALNSRERIQFSPCDDDPEDDRLRSQTSQLLTKLM